MTNKVRRRVLQEPRVRQGEKAYNFRLDEGHHGKPSSEVRFTALRRNPAHVHKEETPKDLFISDLDTSSSKQEEATNVVRIKHMLKPPKFDGVMPFETFWALFQNCAKHNQWDQTQKLVYLQNSLDKEAANILWDYGKENRFQV